MRYVGTRRPSWLAAAVVAVTGVAYGGGNAATRPAERRVRIEGSSMRLATRILLSVAAGAIAAGASSLPVWSAQVDIELFAPAREANSALQAAYRAKAQDLAPRDLRLAEVYFEDARAALNPPAGAPDEAKAASLFRLAGAAAKVAETRSVEVVRERDAAGAGNQYLEAIEGDPKRILPPRPPLGMAQAEYSRLQREAAAARAARRAAEAAFEQLRSQVR